MEGKMSFFSVFCLIFVENVDCIVNLVFVEISWTFPAANSKTTAFFAELANSWISTLRK